MRRFISRVMSVVAASAVISAAAAPKLYNPVAEEEFKVAPTGSWQVLASGGAGNMANTPGGMLAARLGDKKNLYRWKPSENRKSLSGEADIVDVLMSQDESMLLFAEKVGGSGKPNSTRFVYFNLISGKICGGFTLPNRRLGRMSFIPERYSCIVAIQHKQNEFGQQNSLVIIDLKKEAVIAESAPVAGEIINVVCDGSMAWFACKNDSVIRQLPLAEFSSAPVQIAGKKDVCGISISADGKVLQVLEKGWAEFFDITSKGAMFSNSIQLPPDFAPDWLLAVPPDNKSVIAAVRNGQALYINGGEFREIAAKAGAFGCIMPANDQLLLGLAVRGRISRMELPDCREILRINPGEFRPVNRNDTLRLFGRTGKVLEAIQVDVRGNVFRLLITDRRGSKRPLLLVDKRGVR